MIKGFFYRTLLRSQIDPIEGLCYVPFSNMSDPIEILEHGVLYENPIPHLRSLHGYFPVATRLPTGDLLALFEAAEDFEAADATVFASRSGDKGKTWHFEGPIYEKP